MGMTRKVRTVLAGACLFLIVPALFPHHGLARFDTTHVISLEGTVTEVQWINPHAVIYADVKDEHGKVVNWQLELGSLAMLGRAGWAHDTFKPGDHVSFSGFVAKDHSPYMSVGWIKGPNGKDMPGAP
jgi:hypothetical protein